MSGLELQLRQLLPPGVRIDLRGVIPSQLHSLTLGEIERLPIQVDGITQKLGEWFKVRGDAAQMELTIEGDCGCCDSIGHGLDGGVLRVEGDAGDQLGHRMKAGELSVSGNVRRYCASQMRGGMIKIAGNASDYAGGANPTERQGLRGGLLVIHGNVGKCAGHRMRRGMMIINGSVDSGLAMRMIAGSIVCCGDVQPVIGCGMRRGTIVLLQERLNRLSDLPGFTKLEESELSFLPILLKNVIPYLPQTVRQNFSVEAEQLPKRGLRSLGDRALGGLGELILLQHSSAS